MFFVFWFCGEYLFVSSTIVWFRPAISFFANCQVFSFAGVFY